MPRLTQDDIHTNFSIDSGDWVAYRAQVTGFYGTDDRQDLDDHLVREFNKKIEDLGMPTGLFIQPYDGGRRYIGDGISF